MMKNTILPAVCVFALALASGCASPGMPQPPSLRLPVVVDNLSAVRKGDRVVLSWSPPAVTTDHQAIRWPTTTLVCRVLNQFPINVCGEVVKQIKSSELASALPAARRPMVSFEDVLPPQLIGSQNQATYAIEVDEPARPGSPDCPTRCVSWLAPTAPPPTGFHATLDAQGPLLQWNVAATPEPAPGISYRLRIYRRARARNEFAMVGELPYRLGQDEARDSGFEWEQEYDYKIAAVTVLAVPGKPVIEVEGNDSNLVHLRVHDTFPPAVPSGLQAVFSSVGQKPFIDLTWAPNTESDLAGYIVYRRSEGSSFVAVSSAPIKAPAWRDNDVHPGQRYYYTVAAVDVRDNQQRAVGSGRRVCARGGAMKFCRFLGMEGSRFGLVETRDGQDFIISELGSPQMQVSAAGVPEQIVLPEPGSGKTIDEPFPLERAKLLIPFPIDQQNYVRGTQLCRPRPRTGA